jgi:hypothetical protein
LASNVRLVISRVTGTATCETAGVQTPVLIFDHINKVVVLAPAGPDADRKMAEMAVAGKSQVSGASTAPPDR